MQDAPAIELEAALGEARRLLLDELGPEGFWTGQLASSPLATAVGAFVLEQLDRERHHETVLRARGWLASNINADGGWGDTPDSPSNLSATLLGWCAFAGSADDPQFSETIALVEKWIVRKAGGLAPEELRGAVEARYGADRTFSVPILTTCALAGRLGPEPDCWRHVEQLPFELAALPHQLYNWLRLSVVSYGVPALIATGLVRHRRRPARCPIRRWLRNALIPRSMGIVRRMQPSDGGYQEAIPLTGFITMCLAAAGFRDCRAVERGERFLAESVRDDGNWPLVINLSTWVTCQSVKALSIAGRHGLGLPADAQSRLREWLLAQQHAYEHPLTHGAPGGWGWTHLPGGMPDADDTSCVLVALRRLGPVDERVTSAAEDALAWLLDLQNRDGGIPTFCRGWGKFVFDRSCPDITAHALRAFVEWRADVRPRLRRRLEHGLKRGLRYLAKDQQPDGAYVPLWFGDQNAPDEKNPTYGTACVVTGLRNLVMHGIDEADALCRRGAEWLAPAQTADGGWGGRPGSRSTIEETAVAIAALAGEGHDDVVCKGLRWLLDATDGGKRYAANPMGLYFARLWYSEKLYPRIFTVAALSAVQQALTDGRQ
jgi:squalene-hopene/tetraprenyl-beta-curcumene cyclase